MRRVFDFLVLVPAVALAVSCALVGAWLLSALVVIATLCVWLHLWLELVEARIGHRVELACWRSAVVAAASHRPSSWGICRVCGSDVDARARDHGEEARAEASNHLR